MSELNINILASEYFFLPNTADEMDALLEAYIQLSLAMTVVGTLTCVVGTVIFRITGSEVARNRARWGGVVGLGGAAAAVVLGAFGAIGNDGAGEKDNAPTSTTPTQDPAPEPQNTGPDIDWGTIGLVVVGIIAGLIVLVLIIVGIRAAWAARTRRRETRETQRRAELEKLARWERLDERHATVRDAYVKAETDPRTVLERPIIRDVSHRLTQAFHTALSDATGALERRLDLDYATEAVDTLTRTWSTLWRTAGEVGLPGVRPGDRRRAHNLLTRILDESIDAPEREAARRRLDAIIESSDLDRDTCAAVDAVVTQALVLSGLPTLREITRGTAEQR